MIASSVILGALALPLVVQASAHNANQRRHHAQVAARAEHNEARAPEPESRNVTLPELMKRADCTNARFTFYDIEVGQYVARYRLVISALTVCSSFFPNSELHARAIINRANLSSR